MSTLELDVGDLRARAVEFTARELVVTLADGRKVVVFGLGRGGRAVDRDLEVALGLLRLPQERPIVHFAHGGGQAVRRQSRSALDP